MNGSFVTSLPKRKLDQGKRHLTALGLLRAIAPLQNHIKLKDFSAEWQDSMVLRNPGSKGTVHSAVH